MNHEPDLLVDSLLDGLTTSRIEIDMIEFSGIAFRHVDNRLMSLKLVELGLSGAKMFAANGEVLQPSEFFYRKLILVERGSFRPVCNVNLDMLRCALEKFSQLPSVAGKEIVQVMEVTMNNLKVQPELSKLYGYLKDRGEINPLEIASLGISTPLRRILTGAVLFLFVCAVAVAGYMAAGWRLDDAVYMVVITIFGVGYGEVHPIESSPLRALTITVIIAGYGAVIYTVGGFMQMLIDDLRQIGLQVNELAVSAGSDLANQAISELEIRGNDSFLIVGVRRVDGSTQRNPRPSEILQPGDVVIVLGHQDDLPEIARRFSRQPVKMSYRGVTVDH